MPFGSQYTKTGKFGAPGIDKIRKAGFQDEDEFFAANPGLNQDSSLEDFGNALDVANARQTAPRNISSEEFKFTGLPEYGTNQATQGLRDYSSTFGQQSRQAFNQGNDTQNFGEGALKGLLGTSMNDYSQRSGQEGQARNRFLGQQESAIDPTISAQGQQFLNQGAGTRNADIERFYGKDGAGREQLARNLANNIADIDQLGVSGTSQASTLANTIGNFNRDYATATQQANELSRGEAVNERNRVGSAYSEAAGRNLQDAQAQGTLQGNLLSLGRGIGSDLTTSGAQRQAIAADLGKLGLTAEDAGLTQDFTQRGQEAELQQGERAFNTDLEQQRIDNERIMKAIKNNKELQRQLMEQYGGGGSGGGILSMFGL